MKVESAGTAHFPRLLLFLPAWLALLFYLPTLTHGFVWDDTYYLLDLPYLRDPALWWQAIQQPLFVSENYFRPLPLLMFAAEARLGGPGAFVFHLVNVLLHAGNTLLLVLLARGLLPTDKRGLWLASGAGLLFSLHPAAVENVSWISDRFDLLMTFFILLALCLEQRMAVSGRRNFMLAVCLLGALLSKEPGVVLLGLMPLWQVFRRMSVGASVAAAVLDIARTQRMLYLMLVGSLLTYVYLRSATLGFSYHRDSQMVAGDVLAHMLLVGKTLVTYVLLLVFPFGQVSPVYPAVTPIAVDDFAAWTGLLFLVVLAWVLVGKLWRGRASAVLLLMALAALAPVLNLLPLTIADNIAHDRYLLLSIAFVALWLAHMLYPLSLRLPQYAVAGWLVTAGVCVAMTIPHWQSNLTLWTWAYAKYPQSQIASGNYLLALLEVQRNEEAVVLGRELLVQAQEPDSVANLRHSLALALARTGDLSGAEREIKLCLEYPRNDDTSGRYGASESLNLLAYVQMEQGRLAAAFANLNEAVNLTPYLPRPHYNLALLHYAQGDLDRGDAELALTLRYAAPQQAPLFSRGAEQARARALRS